MSAATPTTGRQLENPLRHRWEQLCIGSLVLTAILFAGALGFLVRFEPRLLTWPEILPPDESLVGVVVAPMVALAISGVLLRRLRWVPRRVHAGAIGVAWDRGGSGTSREVAWTAVSVPASSGSWEGDRLDILEEGGRTVHLWVDRSLAADLRLRKDPGGASADLPRPQR